MKIERYSCIDSRGCIESPYTFWCRRRYLKPTRVVSKKSGTLPLASTSTTSTFLPRWAAIRASAAAVVLLPTPPLPVRMTTRRSMSCSRSAPRSGIA